MLVQDNTRQQNNDAYEKESNHHAAHINNHAFPQHNPNFNKWAYEDCLKETKALPASQLVGFGILRYKAYTQIELRLIANPCASAGGS